MAVSAAAVIVGDLIWSALALNTLLPAGKTDIVQASCAGYRHAAADTLHMPVNSRYGHLYVLAHSRLTPRWWGRFICSVKPCVEDNLLGTESANYIRCGKRPPLPLTVQVIIVTVLCFSTFISPSVAAAYWMLTALTTITYFIPSGDVPPGVSAFT